MRDALIMLSLLILVTGAKEGIDQVSTFHAEVERVVDGDTFYASVEVPDFNPKSFEDVRYERHIRIRLHGCDTYEINSPDVKHRELAKKGKRVLTDLLENSEIKLVYQYKDHFGRLVCDVYVDGSVNVCDILHSKDLLTGRFYCRD